MVIGIGGVSRSGKSKLAQYMVSVLKGTTQVFDLDNFLYPSRELPRINGLLDWEQPSSLDLDKLLQSVRHCKSDHKIIEGIFAFDFEDLIDLYDYSILLHIPYSEFIHRRKREIRWGNEPRWYIEYVWNVYYERESGKSLINPIALSGIRSLQPQLKDISFGR